MWVWSCFRIEWECRHWSIRSQLRTTSGIKVAHSTRRENCVQLEMHSIRCRISANVINETCTSAGTQFMKECRDICRACRSKSGFVWHKGLRLTWLLEVTTLGRQSQLSGSRSRNWGRQIDRKPQLPKPFHYRLWHRPPWPGAITFCCEPPQQHKVITLALPCQYFAKFACLQGQSSFTKSLLTLEWSLYITLGSDLCQDSYRLQMWCSILEFLIHPDWEG